MQSHTIANIVKLLHWAYAVFARTNFKEPGGDSPLSDLTAKFRPGKGRCFFNNELLLNYAALA